MRTYWQYTVRKYGIIILYLVPVFLASSIYGILISISGILMIAMLAILKKRALKNVEHIREKIDNTLVCNDNDAAEYYAVIRVLRIVCCVGIVTLGLQLTVYDLTIDWSVTLFFVLFSICLSLIASYIEWQNYRDSHNKQNNL